MNQHTNRPIAPSCPHCPVRCRSFLDLDRHLKWECRIVGKQNDDLAFSIASILAPA